MKKTKYDSYRYILTPDLVPYNEVHEFQSNTKYYKDGLLQAIINKNEMKWRD